MKLIRGQETWDPFRDVDDLATRVNRLFGLTKWNGESLAMADWVPSCNVSEDEKEYRVRAELPDVKKDDVHVTLENGVLTIEGERKEEKEEKDLKFHRRELSYGKFVRRFAMPEEADESKIQASFHDGMLEVTIAKSKVKAPKYKEIPVA
ncbi:MAG TPA: Hsp20/alpha crystallin family protein [Candidatus Krumholzibacteria bacterium]|nr:Hsp20/alpha crystallin family protein [Candidatus Krumholzibacteria bacterium]